MERLQRVIASYGLTSRRKAESMIVDGRVSVDGTVVRELGIRVDPSQQEIRVDGRLMHWERRRYLILNKPSGYITTAADERGRRTVLDLVDVPERVVPVGRLDRKTSGLLMLTNDGELLFRVTHPKFELEKEYEVHLDGFPPPAALSRLRKGVIVDGAKVVPSQVRPMRNEETGLVLRIIIHEGRNRIVRRMMERIGYPVLKLERTRVGPLQIRGLPTGAWRDLTSGELSQIRESVGLGDEDVNERAARSVVAPRDSADRSRDVKRGPRERVRNGTSSAGRRNDRRRDRTQPTERAQRGRQTRDRDRRPGSSGEDDRRQ